MNDYVELNNGSLPYDARFLLRMKAYEFRQDGVENISFTDLEDYLFEIKWKDIEELSMCEVIDDIMSLDFSTVFDYLKVKVIKEAKTLNIDHFQELISK